MAKVPSPTGRAAARGRDRRGPPLNALPHPPTAGNWKCNGTIDMVTQLVKDLNAGVPLSLVLTVLMGAGEDDVAACRRCSCSSSCGPLF